MSGPTQSFGIGSSLQGSIGRPLPKMRSYWTMSFNAAGEVREKDVQAPTSPEFEAAFNAFARGTLITTPGGQTAIEDLRPGQKVITREHGPQVVQWIGIMTHAPKTHGRKDDALPLLTRITTDRFGPSRPSPDLVVGPGARLLHRPANVDPGNRSGMAYVPVRDFIDGDSIIGINPREETETYHICVRRHGTIRAAGLDVETFHPGPALEKRMGSNTREVFLSMFPHIRIASDFGLTSHPRMRLSTSANSGEMYAA